MEVFKNKFLWINLVAIIIEIIQYVITNNLFPGLTNLLTYVIGGLTLIINYLAGVKTETQVKKLEYKLSKTIK